MYVWRRGCIVNVREQSHCYPFRVLFRKSNKVPAGTTSRRRYQHGTQQQRNLVDCIRQGQFHVRWARMAGCSPSPQVTSVSSPIIGDIPPKAQLGNTRSVFSLELFFCVRHAALFHEYSYFLDGEAVAVARQRTLSRLVLAFTVRTVGGRLVFEEGSTVFRP